MDRRRLALGERRTCESVAELEIRQISDRVWRIGNSAHDERSPDKILGVIQRHADGFQVFAMESPGPDPVFDCWEAALASFVSPRNEAEKPAQT
jgi:hypothetical protein